MRRIIRPSIELTCAAVLLFGAFLATQGPLRPRAIDAIEAGRATRAAVVTPRVNVGPFGGTATPLGGGLFLTAWHVLAAGGPGAEVTVAAARTSDRVPARVMWSSRDNDLAMLYAPLFKTEGFPVRCDDARIGEEVVIMGWPGNLGYHETQGHITSRPGRPFTLYQPGGPHVYAAVQWTTAHIGYGMSGGPVVDVHNRLAGIAVLGVPDFYGIVPASEVCRALGRT